MSLDDVVTAERGRLFGLAYRMLGTASEAEDAVQEAFARLAATSLDELDEPAAWLTTVTTRICIDRLRAARRRREAYVGPWLPEPVATDDLDPAAGGQRVADARLPGGAGVAVTGGAGRVPAP